MPINKNKTASLQAYPKLETYNRIAKLAQDQKISKSKVASNLLDAVFITEDEADKDWEKVREALR